jgi:hypothetical protein
LRDRGIVLFGSALLLWVLLMLTACGRLVSSGANDLADNLSQAIANNDDPATVRAGGPAYLLMLDGMVQRDPQNEDLLMRAAALYSAYGDMFVDDPARARRLSQRAFDYASRALCVHTTGDCDLRSDDFERFQARIDQMTPKEVPLFYTWAAAWAGWIQARRDDLNAVAELARVEAIMQRLVLVDEGYRWGSVHLYLGTFAILVPPALGGKPDVARAHFERAIALSAGQNLMAKVMFARRYARMVYDRPLHDRLLAEVLAADPHVPGLVLWNTLAQDQARDLLETADNYF